MSLAVHALIGALLCAASVRDGALGDHHESTVGVPARIEELVLPGSRLEVAPADSKTPLELRITASSAHGNAFRYDLEYTGLDPGTYDLRSFLRRENGSTTADLPPIEVEIRTLLAAGQSKPRAPGDVAAPALGGYRALAITCAVLWTCGLIALLCWGRKRRERTLERKRAPTLADRLQPLVERALAGELSHTQCAQLEANLIAYWRRKLDLDRHRPAEALALLHAHAQAGPLLHSLEAWLHRPVPQVPADIAALLAPYRDLAPGTIELPDAAARD